MQHTSLAIAANTKRYLAKFTSYLVIAKYLKLLANFFYLFANKKVFSSVLKRRDGVVVRTSASQSVDLWFNPLSSHIKRR